MKSTLTLFLAVTTITLGVVCVVQTRKFGGQQTQLASLRAELDEKAQQIETLQSAQKRSEQQRHELMNQAEGLAAQLQARPLAETNATAAAPTNRRAASEGEKRDGEKGGFGKMLSKMMQDPDTRKFMRDQQRVMMDQLYTPLIKKMGLTPDEAAKFKDLLADNTMNAAENASSMFGGQDSTNRAATIDTLAASQKTFDEQVKAFLGDDRYAQYKDYQDTAAERMQLNAFRQQAGNDYPLNDQQTEALLTFMQEEKKNVAAATGLPPGDGNKDSANLQAVLSDDKVSELLQTQEAVGQRVYERARTILSPDQLDSFGQFQTNQLQMMRVGMRMASKMFAPDKPAADAAPAESVTANEARSVGQSVRCFAGARAEVARVSVPPGRLVRRGSVQDSGAGVSFQLFLVDNGESWAILTGKSSVER